MALTFLPMPLVALINHLKGIHSQLSDKGYCARPHGTWQRANHSDGVFAFRCRIVTARRWRTQHRTDFEPEEIRRHISISAAIAPLEWKQKAMNLIDVPGYFDFIGEMMGPLRVVETAAILVSAVSGIAVGTEKAWSYATKNNVGKMFIVNQMDREHADFMKVQERLREKFGSSVVPILLPIGNGPEFKGVVNVLENKAYEGTGKNRKEVPVPAAMSNDIATALEEITEAAAAADDDLMLKYLDEGSLSHEEILEGFKIGMFSGMICPVIPCSALTGMGVANLLDVIADFLPSLSGRYTRA